MKVFIEKTWTFDYKCQCKKSATSTGATTESGIATKKTQKKRWKSHGHKNNTYNHMDQFSMESSYKFNN